MKSRLLEDGRRLAWRESGTGPPLVLLHGWAMSSAIFSGVIDELAGSYRVLAPDLRGHGASEGGGAYRFTDMAADLRQWLEGLGIREATVLGWSLGGQVLLTLYPEMRDRIARLILVAGTPFFVAGQGWAHGLPPTRLKVMSRNLKRNFQRTVEDFFDLQFVPGELDPPNVDRLASLRAEIPLPEFQAALAGLEELQANDQRDRLPAIDCPVLVVHGGGDSIIPCEAGRYLARHLPQARLKVLAGVGHAPFLSRPEETLDIWRDFLP